MVRPSPARAPPEASRHRGGRHHRLHCQGPARLRRAGTAPAVELHGITKRFPGVVANKDIEITVRRGTVHAIVEENGAGKSTLMKILYGVQQPDEGTIAVNGQTLTLRSPTDAINAGIGMVFQHFMLADNLTSSRTSSSARRSCTASARKPARRSKRSPTPTGSG